MISGIAFDRLDRLDRLSRLRTFPYDRFKIYTIVPIVRIDLNSIHSIEVVSIVRVVCDRPDNVSIIWSSDRLNIIWNDWDKKPGLSHVSVVIVTT